jgi:hypothetical protein
VSRGFFMIAVGSTDRFGRIVSIATVTVMLLAAVALVGCGGTIESPGGPSGTGAPEGAETLVAPEAVRTEMLGVLKAAGYVVSDPMYVYVNYESAAKDSVLVTGSFKGAKGEALTFAKLKSAAGKWAVVEVK